MNNEIKFTETQQQIFNYMKELSTQKSIQESIRNAKSCDVILSINRPSRLKMFISSVKRLFKRLFGIKDNTGVMYVHKNRCGNKHGALNLTIDYKQKTITKNK